MKICTICKKEFPLDCFNKKKSTEDGLQNICKTCSQERSRAYYKKNKKAHLLVIYENKKMRVKENRTFILSYFDTHPCVDCGEKTPACLEFDHVRPGKFKIISELVSEGYALNTIKKEISLCDVRCANCHRKKTAIDFNWYSK